MKKINYGGIPDDVLDIEIGEDYFSGNYTLRSEIDKFGEDLIAQRHNLRIREDYSYVEWFQAWSDKHSFMLVDGMFGDRVLLAMDRNPPKEAMNVRSKDKKDKRSKPRRSRKAGRK